MTRYRILMIAGATLAGLIASMLAPLEAKACNRCGLFGNKCKFVQHHAAAYVAPVAVVKQPDLFIVQNNYPAPNGQVGLLAQQGASIYGYQSAAAQYFVNPADVLRQAAELARAAGATAQLGLTGYNQTAQTQLSIQASMAEPLIKSQAAVAVLGAAGLSQSSVVESQALHLVRQTDGRWVVSQADPAQVTARYTASITAQTSNGQASPILAQSAPKTLLGAKCASCHGVNLKEPKAEVHFDDPDKLAEAGIVMDCNLYLRAIKAIKAGKMPKDSALTPEQKGSLIYELTDLTKPAE